MYFLAEPLAFIIRPIYNIIKDYGMTLIVVTVLIRLLTIPFSKKQEKCMKCTSPVDNFQSCKMLAVSSARPRGQKSGPADSAFPLPFLQRTE